jgi:hypothetical protein
MWIHTHSVKKQQIERNLLFYVFRFNLVIGG